MTAINTPAELLSYASASAIVSTAAEKTIVAADQCFSSTSARPVRVHVCLNITMGTTATQYIVRVRRTGINGVMVQPPLTVNQTDGVNDQFAHTWTDLPTGLNRQGGERYVATVEQTGITVNGVVNACDIEVTQ